MSKDGIRELKVAELIRRAMADVFLKTHLNAKLSENVTITEVRVSPGLGLAKIYIISSNKSETDKKVKDLNDNKKTIRFYLAKFIKLKYMPDILFLSDNSMEESMHIDELLSSDSIKKDLMSDE